MKLVTKQLSAKKGISVITALFILLTTTAYGKKQSNTNAAAPPVFWNVFKAEAKKDKVQLTWIVTEYNNKVFYIEHSLNGSEWRTIDSVDTKNSPLTLDEYTYTHTNKLEGRQYYRLKQVDIDLVRDGYSEVITLVLRKTNENKTGAGITLWPNPVTDHVRITNDNENNSFYTKAMIFDLSGKMVAEKRSESHTNTFMVKDLPAGIYIVRAENSNGVSFTQKMIKQ